MNARMYRRGFTPLKTIGTREKTKMSLTGFTLIELFIVMAIIVIIIAISVPGFQRMRANANISKAKGDLEMLKAAVESYMSHQDPASYPNSTTQLWQDYLRTAIPRIVEKALYDPFRGDGKTYEYQYVLSGDGNYYCIWSWGIDGVSSITGIGDDGLITPENKGDDIYVSNGSTQ